MAIFGFGKKKEETCTQQKCACGALNIKVLGSGCKSCKALLSNVQEAVQGVEGVEVEYVTDMEKIMSYGVMRMPALVVDEQVVSMGKVLNAEDVIKLLVKLGLLK